LGVLVLEADQGKGVPETDDISSVGARDDGNSGDEFGEARSADSSEDGLVDVSTLSQALLVGDGGESITNKRQALLVSVGVISHAQQTVEDEELEKITSESIDVDTTFSTHVQNSGFDRREAASSVSANGIESRHEL